MTRDTNPRRCVDSRGVSGPWRGIRQSGDIAVFAGVASSGAAADVDAVIALIFAQSLEKSKKETKGVPPTTPFTKEKKENKHTNTKKLYEYDIKNLYRNL